MQFRVVIPEHVQAGQTIRIHCPDDTEANVKVPMGLRPGDSFIFELTSEQLTDPQVLMQALQMQNEANNNNNASTSGSSSSRKKSKSSSGPRAPWIEPPRRGFLDRDIANLHDFLLALGVGLIIGMGIVIGFILGVLSVTQDMGPDIHKNVTDAESLHASSTQIPTSENSNSNSNNNALYFSHTQNIPQSSSNRILGTASSFSNNVKIKNANSSPKLEL